MFPDDLKEYIDTHAEGTYTLLDVRQAVEFEDGHLPGAKLISLPELGESLDQLDRDKPTIVYCAVGGRSRTVVQYLLHRGFQNVFLLEGGIDAWEEGIASGPVEFPLKFMRGDEGPEETIRLACLMEEGLKRFHLAILNKTDDPDFSKLLTQLVKAEEGHERTLLSMMPDLDARDAILRELSSDPGAALIEGGIDLQEYLRQNDRFLKSIEGYLELAMMIETQAMDLYLRLGDLSRNVASREIFFKIGDEEKAHLAMLGGYLDSILEKR
jgi:sulfur-carrier protein adenylyltransferase/sulfurtransferase